MGVTFRSGGYIKFVRCSGRTIKDGEAAAIWDSKGQHTEIVGPRRVWLFMSTIRFLTRHKAESHQYARVAHRDGRVEHIHGPVSIYQNPAKHDNISVHDGYRLNSSSECLIVFNNDTSTKAKAEAYEASKHPQSQSPVAVSAMSYAPEDESKMIIRGPRLFFPSPDESVHTFSWSEADMNPKESEFSILKTSTEDLSTTLSVPSSDGFVLQASLAIEYHTESIDNLISIKDPLEKLHNALLADSQTLQKSFSGDHFRMGKQDEIISNLSGVETYPQLMASARLCGLSINSVRVTGLEPCDALSRYINEEQTLNAKVRSDLAKNSQRRTIRQLELEDKRKSIEEEAALKQMQVKTTAKLDEESYKMKQAALSRKIALEKTELDAVRQKELTKDENVLLFLKRLRDMDVDMNAFLTTTGKDAVHTITSRSQVLQTLSKTKNRMTQLENELRDA
jgi:hypothetical protein